MKGSLNRSQQQKLRKELQNRVRLDGYCFERQAKECCSGNNGRNKGEIAKGKISKNRVSAKDAHKDSSRNNNRVSQQLGSGKRILFPKAKLVLVLFALGGIVLAVWSFSDSNPGALQVGSAGILEFFSVSHDKNTSDQGANEQSVNGVGLGDSISFDSSASWQRHYSNDLPSGFDEEIGLTGESVAVSNKGRTIGYINDGSVEETMADIRTKLEEKGWSYVPSGQESVATFVKDTGIFCWLAVSCVSVEGETSVVLVPEKNPE